MGKIGEFAVFVWNAEEKRFFGRKGRAWGEICLFFSVFYICLLAWFCSMMCFFNTFIDPFEPTLQDATSFLQHPGLAFRPQVDFGSNEIVFTNRAADPLNADIIYQMEEIMQPYVEGHVNDWPGSYRNRCSDGDPVSEFPCPVDNYDLEAPLYCSRAEGFGYNHGSSPCVMLRLNKVYNWKPRKYTESDIDKSPMPDSVKELAKQRLNHLPSRLFIWVWCYGVTKQDTDNMGEVRYLPEDQGFPYYFYPYRNQWKYLQPFVMVVFTHLKPNVKVQVQCRVWAPGIEVIPLERQGSVHFTLLYKKEVL